MGGQTSKRTRTRVEPKPAITLGAQVGDERADEATNSHCAELRKLLREHCAGPYSREIDEFAFVLRIDGDIWHWEFEGPDKLRLRRKARYITVDIGMPRSRWDGVKPESIRSYLSDSLTQGLAQMMAALTKSKVEFDAARLSADFGDALRRYRESLG